MDSDADPRSPERLNADFYMGNPAVYFRTRLNLLLLAAGAPERLDALVAEGVTYEGLRMQEMPRSTEASEGEHLAFLIVESQSLLHHASEALIRLYLAHRRGVECPWLEVSRLRTPNEFKRELFTLANEWTQETRHQANFVFLGSEENSESGDFEEASAAVERLMRSLAKLLLDDAALYNSAKHGMAVMAGESSISLGIDQATFHIGNSGASVEFLEVLTERSGRRWQRTTRWVSVPQAIWLAQLALVEIDALWQVARARYSDGRFSGVQTVTAEAVEEAFRRPSPEGGSVSRFSLDIWFEEKAGRTRQKGRRKRGRP